MRTVKRLLGRSLFASHLDALLLRRAAVVVAFHRVQRGADVSDGLTVDPQTFGAFCEFFRRHFHVVPLSELIGKLEKGRTPSRELAITFDDGYRDNFENAMPILENLGLPATFFVVSGWIGTDVVPFWDRALGVQHPWMTWDQIRTLKSKGFDIGAHTRTHVNLGTTSGAIAQDEIAGARADLEVALSAPVETFAYPFGGQDNMTELNRQVVKAAGFRCCCSAFGGTITGKTDPFLLPRVPVTTWHLSPQHFGFDVALGRSVWCPETSSSAATSPISTRQPVPHVPGKSHSC
jgi:peptidoglycan/xylan/chitin deacetylase (PgdA/CDA1 family)